MISEVIVDIKNKQVNRSFDYKIPAHLSNIIDVGFRVLVPFGNTKRVGYVINIKDDTLYKKNLKEIIDIVDVKPILSKEFIEIGKTIAEENFSFYAKVYDAMIPSILKSKYQKVATILDFNNRCDELKEIFKRKSVIIDNLSIDKQRIIYSSFKKGLVSIDTKLKRIPDDRILMVHLVDQLYESRIKRIRELIEYLIECDSDIEAKVIKEELNITEADLNDLISKKIISTYYIEPESKNESVEVVNEITLNTDQKKVYNSISYNENKIYLLHGITGSGKTEIYIKWISDMLNIGKSSLLLVPEISLTPQISSVLKSRFKTKIEVLHSRLTNKERYEAWKRIYNNEVKIVVGARSAIFAPLDDLGIIIVDEAHENSYRQTNNPKYDAIEIAKIRAKNHNIPLVLGTATPKIIDYYKATNSEYELLELKKRSNNMPLPKCDLVDMREELKTGNRLPFSRTLISNLKKNLENNEQSILFLNRRGYSTFVMCRNCGEVVKCPHCDISLTYHKYKNILKCHQCGYMRMNVESCDVCGSDKIKFVGNGTEKIYENLQSILPDAKIIRVDTDTIKSTADYESYYTKFKNHEADIIIGTQMITKGLDFDDVTLVGVLNADLALYYPSYDSYEVAFNLIEQVSGRAGRSKKPGRVIIQTYDPNNYVITSAINHNYDDFYNMEINKRRLQNLPPFSIMIKLSIKSLDKIQAFNEINMISSSIKSRSKSNVFSPNINDFKRKNDYFIYSIVISLVDDVSVDIIKNLYPKYQLNQDVILDIERI